MSVLTLQLDTLDYLTTVDTVDTSSRLPVARMIHAKTPDRQPAASPSPVLVGLIKIEHAVFTV